MTSSLLKLVVRRVALTALILVSVLVPQLSCGETITTTVGVGVYPRSVAVNPVTNKFYVVNYNDNAVTVINGNTNAPIPPPIPVGTYPSAIAVNPVTNIVYVVNQEQAGYGTVTVIDGATDTVSATVTVRFLPSDIAVNPVTNKVYVANSYSSSVTVIDGATNGTTHVDVGMIPVAIAVNQVTNKIYVANEGNGINSSTVTVIDGATNIPVPTAVPVGVLPTAIAVNTVTNKVYVANRGNGSNSGTVTVIEGSTNLPDPTPVPVGVYPFAVVLNLNTNKVYVANRGDGSSSGTVTVIDGVSNGTSFVTVGTTPYAVAVNPGTNRVYVANRGSDNVTLIDGATNTHNTLAAPSDQVWDAPRAIAVNQETNKVYVANEISGNVTVIQNFYTISITKTGAGTGTVTSLPSGISCGATCSATFAEGAAVVLYEAPATNSGFIGWVGCTRIDNYCSFSILSDKSVSADFTLSPWVKNQTTGVAYSALQDAYNEAKDYHTITARNTLPAAGLTLNKDTILSIEGGYDYDYSTCIGLTTVLGRVNVSLAPLHVHGLAIRSMP